MSKPNINKMQAGKAAKKAEHASQVIKINDEWSVVRLDFYNWQIKQKGKKEPWDRWYYSSVKTALYGVFEKALNEQPHKWLRSLPELASKIQDCLDRLIE
jgi:hypothetical protein